ncbi:hypothetical protein EV421DRAFT_2018746 [Armillaria borealis]|uniref:Uncharacterized protein n=1 Tax=Armillaria borealis TaxID=47425 RepID=A0AA39JQ60_9AGAR|nr:hypothetical protein EV421DRAFT_2018746 [Armillaria borealis]
MATNTTTSGRIPFPSPPPPGKFAFARLCSDREVYLVQLAEHVNNATPIPSRIHFYFRLAGSKTVRLSDIRILEVIDDAAKRYEEEQGVVFLARGLVSGIAALIHNDSLSDGVYVEAQC